MAVQLNFNDSMAALAHTFTHTQTHALARTLAHNDDVSTHTCHTNVFFPSFSPSISCAVPFISVASTMIQASGIATVNASILYANPKQMNEQTNEKTEKKNAKADDSSYIHYMHSAVLGLWCHAQNLMAAHCFQMSHTNYKAIRCVLDANAFRAEFTFRCGLM